MSHKGDTSAIRYRVCPLCEATCGLTVEISGRTVRSIRGDPQDVLSHGYLCPKAIALEELDTDPDRLRAPLLRRGGGFVEVSWDEAYHEVEHRLLAILDVHGPSALATYVGNPTVHNASLMIYFRIFATALPTPNRFSASTVDQMPKHVSCGLMFGDFLSIPVPDIDRCSYLLMLGANPMASNGSLFTAPGFRARARALRERGGRLVVVDPRRSATARIADRHVSILPGSDALLLAGMAHTLFDEGLVKPGRLEEHTNGLAEIGRALQDFPAEQVATPCGIDAGLIRELARELAAAEAGAVYGRIGTCTQRFGTTASWLVDVLNVLTGNLDRPGGAMFPLGPAFVSNAQGAPGRGSGVRLGRRRSRVRGAPEVMGEYPIACLAEEIETPGPEQIRALITVAGNPVLSGPNSGRLARALSGLDLMVSLDLYLNETTRHADVILPGLSPLETSHFDVVFPQVSVRNWARHSPPVFVAPEGPEEWQTLLRLAAIPGRRGAAAQPWQEIVEPLDDLAIRFAVQQAVADAHSPIHGRDVDEILRGLEPRRGPERFIDLALRSGAYGDAFGARPEGLLLERVEAHPHGIDLGPLQPRIPELLRTPSGGIELAPDPLLVDLERLRAALREPAPRELRLIGRRHVRSNNSWLHNLPRLARGPMRCTLQIHPDDATRLGLTDGGSARVHSRVGSVEAAVEITDAIRPGVVSLPHGWGHDHDGTRMQVAVLRPGVNSNRLADEQVLDPLSGNAVLNGIPVSVEAV
ncbi:MAG: molybdopterin oxidoreductase family protein [Myxococcota bacterium]